MKVAVSFLIVSALRFYGDIIESSFELSGEHKTVRLSVYDEDAGKPSTHLGTVTIGAEQIACDELVQGTFPLVPGQFDVCRPF
jgi:hypothetical protein